jgi:hypothetical protein
MWSARDVRLITDYVMSMSERTLRAPSPARIPAPAADPRRKLADAGIAVADQMQPGDRRFAFRISDATVDHSGDSIDPAGFDLDGYKRNPVVLNAHNSQATPIATSTVPVMVGRALMATAQFPARGISAASDEVADAVRAGLLRGASVGFIPLKWAFSKDPSRPNGIDFASVRLLEWSLCAVPCNPAALLVGAVAAGKAHSPSPSATPKNGLADLAERRRDEARMDRVAEARKLARMARQ